MFPLLLIVIGILVLVIGKRLAVLGAAVGALLGVGLLSLLSPSGGLLIQLLLVGGLAVIGFFVAGFAKGHRSTSSSWCWARSGARRL